MFFGILLYSFRIWDINTINGSSRFYSVYRIMPMLHLLPRYRRKGVVPKTQYQIGGILRPSLVFHNEMLVSYSIVCCLRISIQFIFNKRLL